jgi:4-hydroxybenzoate polyprenyltransferase
MSVVKTSLSFSHSLWIYQSERFPLLANGILIALFTASAILYSAYVRGGLEYPQTSEVLAGYGTVLLFFLLMRFLDEFKDAEDDARYRPYRPVPRGLISLHSIACLAVGVLVLQVLLQHLWLPEQFELLIFMYAYLLLMTIEFGRPLWLKNHPTVYALSHMMIMPIIGLYATGIDWVSSGPLPPGLLGYLALLFCSGLVIELGRKIRAPDSEEHGVDTYSSLYGPKRAATFWLVSVLGTLLLALWLLHETKLATLLSAILGAGFIACSVAVLRYRHQHVARTARHIELMSGLWSLLLFSSIAVGTYTHTLLEAL